MSNQTLGCSAATWQLGAEAHFSGGINALMLLSGTELQGPCLLRLAAMHCAATYTLGV